MARAAKSTKKKGWLARRWGYLVLVAGTVVGFLGGYDTLRNDGKLFVCDVAGLIGQGAVVPGCVEQPAIPPLENPRQIPLPSSGGLSGSASVVKVAATLADASAAVNAPPPRTARILEGDSDSPQRRLFDITIENPTGAQITLDSLEARWRYYRGGLASIARAEVIKPTEKYTIIFDIDTKDTSQHSKSILVSPTIILPAASPAAPSVYVFRLELLYVFAPASMTYHPNLDWNILFDLDLKTTAGQVIPIFRDQRWRG
jgi:hypothetical protein